MVYVCVPVLHFISEAQVRVQLGSYRLILRVRWSSLGLSKERAPEDVKLPFHHACLEQFWSCFAFFQSLAYCNSLHYCYIWVFRSGIHVLEWQVQSINIIQRLSVKIDVFHVGPDVRGGNDGSCTTSPQQELHGYQPLVFRPWHWQHYNFVTLTLHVVAYLEYFTYGWPDVSSSYFRWAYTHKHIQFCYSCGDTLLSHINTAANPKI